MLGWILHPKVKNWLQERGFSENVCKIFEGCNWLDQCSSFCITKLCRERSGWTVFFTVNEKGTRVRTAIYNVVVFSNQLIFREMIKPVGPRLKLAEITQSSKKCTCAVNHAI